MSADLRVAGTGVAMVQIGRDQRNYYGCKEYDELACAMIETFIL